MASIRGYFAAPTVANPLRVANTSSSSGEELASVVFIPSTTSRKEVPYSIPATVS